MFRLALTSAVATVASAASFCDPAPGWTPVWSDEFEGTSLNTSNWNVLTDDDIGSCRTALCQAANVAVEDGALVLTSLRQQVDGFEYTTGAVNSMGKQHWPYSPVFRMCASAKLPGNASAGKGGVNQGIWPAIWMMPEMSSKQCWPDLGEVDVLEMINGDGYAHGTYHWNKAFPRTRCTYEDDSWTSQLAMPSDWDTAFHEYAVERGPNYVAYVYDGVLVANRTGIAAGAAPNMDAGAEPADAAATARRAEAAAAPAAGPSASPLPTQPLYWDAPFYIILNTAIGGPWPGNATAETVLPVRHVIDYVRVVTKN